MRRLFLTSVLMIMAISVACAPSPTPVPPSATVAPQSKASATSSASSASSTSSTTSSKAPATTAPAQTIKVEAFDDFFRPEKITITAGTQVTWTNVGKKTHTITYKDMFDMDIKPGETFSYTFDKAGTYQYYCVTHSESDTEGMVGTITVTEKK